MGKIIPDNVSGLLNRRHFLTMMTVFAGGLAISPGTAEARPEQVNNSLFSITGVPDRVNSSAMQKTANETVPAAGDVRHENEIGLGSEHFVAEPGNRTLTMLGVVVENGKLVLKSEQMQKDLDDINNGAAWELTPDRQRTFNTPDAQHIPVEEGAFTLFTGPGMDLQFEDKSDAQIHLGARPGHTWFALVRGFERDNQIDTDPNATVIAENFHAGYAMATLLPPGQYVSEDYLGQNVAAAHGKFAANNSIACGADGCSGVSVFMLDGQTGGYTVINQRKPDTAWTLRETNIK